MILFRAIKYQLYLLQLESYELGRYFRLLLKKGFWPQAGQRKDLTWTKKAILVLGLAVLLHLAVTAALVFYGQYILAAAVFLLLTACYFLLYIIAVLLLWPADYLAKQIIILRAKSKIKSLKSKPVVIGIAGSYGKTTMKEILKEVLGAQYAVLSTPESVNTPVGIARFILKKVSNETEVLIVEMGEHYQGDIADICNLIKPDIAVVTGINESHLERMGKLEEVTNTIFEIVSGAKPHSMVFLNADDQNVVAHYKEYVWPDQKVLEYGSKNLKAKNFSQEELAWHVADDFVGEVQVKMLGEYALADVDAAIQVGRSLGIEAESLRKGIAKIKPVDHRLQPIMGESGVLVIDDAYNGNPAGVKEAIKVLSKFAGRRKVYITPGLVEMGEAAPEIHREIGKQLVGVADVVVLIKNSVTPFIAEGLGGSSKIMWFDTAPEAHASLGKILQPGDVVVFQNDWGDQYL